MPKPLQGIETVDECRKLDIKVFTNPHIISKNLNYKGVLSWRTENGDNLDKIGVEVNLSSEEGYVRLNYFVKSGINYKEIDYKINLVSVKSNLGKGEIYYFLCPMTDLRCRILYMAYGSDYFKSRFAYRNRIYYDCQTYSHKLYSVNRYFYLKDKYERTIKINYRKSYRGMKTRSFEKIEKLKEKVNYFDKRRTMDMYLAVLKLKEINF